MIREQIGAFNRLYNYQIGGVLPHHFSWQLNYFLWHDQVEISIPVISYLTTREWVFQPGVSYKPTDGLKISAGYSALYGPDESLWTWSDLHSMPDTFP